LDNRTNSFACGLAELFDRRESAARSALQTFQKGGIMERLFPNNPTDGFNIVRRKVLMR
jgi:hypothetical protein